MTEVPYTATEVIRLDAYLLKDDNDNVLTSAWNSYVIFSPKIQSYHCLLNVCSYKSAPTRTLSARVARGLHEDALLPLFSFTIIW